jgi:hypothetical protein
MPRIPTMLRIDQNTLRPSANVSSSNHCTRTRLAGLAMMVAAFVGLMGPPVQAQNPVAPEPPPVGTTDQGTVIVPSAPPGISVTPSTRPTYRPPIQREFDGQPPVEGCPAGEKRKLELLV